jgi:hypothetical protein
MERRKGGELGLDDALAELRQRAALKAIAYQHVQTISVAIDLCREGAE